eukprot:TRINITY_DN6027_c0_g1_i1.p1 TRINITY_DN6027_c0_g1~~TRINITY_DN6027_c0_g1_i1.p1  ORF type:complete len:1383 (-),score=353.30 TRINITY_DN6027_c0_g1_i1:179-4192(-)
MKQILESIRNNSLYNQSSNSNQKQKNTEINIVNSNITKMICTVEEFLFYPFKGVPQFPDPSMVDVDIDCEEFNFVGVNPVAYPKSHDLVETVLDIVLTMNITLTPQLRNTLVRLATSCFFHISKPITRISFMLRSILSLDNVQKRDALHESRLYALHVMLNACLYVKMEKLIEQGEEIALLTRDLLVYYFNHAMDKNANTTVLKFKDILTMDLVDQASATPSPSENRLIRFFAESTNVDFIQNLIPDLHQRISHPINDEINLHRTISTKCLELYKFVHNEIQDREIKEHEAIITLEEYLNSEKLNFSTSNEGRMITKQYFMNLRSVQATQWRRIKRMHQHMRDTSAFSKNDDRDQYHWKLDQTENKYRMHLKLKRNNFFNDHRDAEKKSSNDLIENMEKSILTKSLLKLPSIHYQRESDTHDIVGEVGNLSIAGKIFGNIPHADSMNEDFLKAMIAEIKNQPSSSTSSSNSTIINPSVDLLLTEREHITQKNNNKVILSIKSDMVTPSRTTKGTLELTSSNLYFFESREDEDETTSTSNSTITRSWELHEISEIHLRRYLLRRSAIEIFFRNRTNFFFNFDKKDRDTFIKKISSMDIPDLVVDTRPPEIIAKASGYTELWANGQLSNFEYIMHLNTIAGRSYNDTTQYPVFPWILSDYTSPSLDLNNPSIYRDLRLPVGALNPERLDIILDRYNSWSDEDIPAFHYGSHYSSAHTVAFYMIRMEPFTTLSIDIQGGEFDHADRLFDSIETTYHNCSKSTLSTDVKELIPEFFYLPEFLRNSNNFNLGTKQNGTKLGDVRLPSWAKTPEEFIRTHREALESDYVSSNLHHWIDLIFGYKQRGEEAINAHNVYHYLTYEGAVDIDKINDPIERKVIEETISNFGQTPCQLFTRPHPQRRSLKLSVSWSIINLDDNATNHPYKVYCGRNPPKTIMTSYEDNEAQTVVSASTVGGTNSGNNSGLPSVTVSSGINLSTNSSHGIIKIITVDTMNQIFVNKVFIKKLSPSKEMITLSQPSTTGRFLLPYHENTPSINRKLFALTKDGKIIFTGGQWDNSIRATVVDQSQLFQSITEQHKGRITSVSVTEDDRFLVTGSEDTTIRVWKVRNYQEYKKSRHPTPLDPNGPEHVLYGHSNTITCVHASSDMNVCLSGSHGLMIMHNLYTGEYVRKILLKNPKEVILNICLDTFAGLIVLYTSAPMIHVYTINGVHLKTHSLNDHPVDVFLIPDPIRPGNSLLVTGINRYVTIRRLPGLEVAQKLQFASNNEITSLGFSNPYILVGVKCTQPNQSSSSSTMTTTSSSSIISNSLSNLPFLKPSRVDDHNNCTGNIYICNPFIFQLKN